MIELREAEPADDDAVWAVLEPVIRSGDAFMDDPDTPRETVLSSWNSSGHVNFVATEGTSILAAYYLQPNQTGLGSHIANASFAVGPAARGRGVGRAMGEHAIDEARRRGYRAMQFNAVVSVNEGALALWRSLGFREVGRLPEAFHLGGETYADTLVMYREL